MEVLQRSLQILMPCMLTFPASLPADLQMTSCAAEHPVLLTRSFMTDATLALQARLWATLTWNGWP